MDTERPETARTRFRRRRQKTLAWTGVIFALLVSGSVASAIWLQGREMLAPGWLRDRIAEQVTRSLPEFQIAFGDVVLVLEEDWRPRLSVRNLQLLTPDGGEIISVTDARAGFVGRALLDRQLVLRSLDVSGVLVTMQRTEDGSFSLRAGVQAGAVRRQAPSILQMVNEMNDWLLRPELAALQHVDLRGVTLQYNDLRAARSWTVDGGRIRLDRAGNDVQIALDLAVLGGTSGVATLSANYAGAIGEQKSDFGITIANLDARDIASQGAAFSWLRAVEAPISGSLRGGTGEDGALNPLNATLQIAAGVIQPNPEARAIPIKGAWSYFSYLPDEQILRFDELRVDSKWGSGRLEGQALLGEVAEGQLDEMVGQFRLTDMKLNPDGLYPEAVEIASAEMDFRLSLAPFALDIGRFQLSDQGHMLTANGRVLAGRQGWRIAMDAEMDALAPARLIALWPERMKPKTRNWISENIQDGLIKDATAALRLEQGGEPNLFLGFDFTEADFTFSAKMPPVEGASGYASLVKDRFVITFDSGGVTAPEGGFVDAAGTSFIVPDTTIKPDPPGVVRLTARSEVTAALSLLDQPPLEIMQKAGLPVDIADGKLALNGTLALPLKKRVLTEDVAFDVAGTVSDASSTGLIKNRKIAAPALSLMASEEAVQLAGVGTLDAVPLDIVWRQELGRPGEDRPGRVTGSVKINQATLNAFNVDLPPGTVSGEGSGTLTLELLKGTAPTLSVQSDLVGLGLNIPPVGWAKAQGTEGLLDLAMTLGTAPRVDRLVVDAPGLYAAGSIELTADEKLDRVQLNDLRVGDWLSAQLDLAGRGEGRPVGVEVRGGTADLRKADLPESRQGSGEGSPLAVNLDRLTISDTISITDLQGNFNTAGGLAGTFSGALNGAAPVVGQLSPRNGRSAIRVTSKDAGRLLSAAGLMQEARGGQMDLMLQPVGSGGAFDGTLRVTDARITEAPTMAALLNSISVVGLINELTGDGIYFSEVTADFRLAPSRITIREAAAVGASMGLSMDGVFEPDTGRLQLQGVISPVYMLNSIGSVLTRRGEGLFGFNYSITGTAADPQVFVNPLTALAPGMLRNLFRGAEPEVPLEEGETAPAPEPRRRPVVTRGDDR
ncbi:MAG: AsmA-like C-terminal region-containing protein [Pseudomonadota bacterium]